LKELDAAFGLAKTGNNEVAFRFYRAAAHAGYRDVRPQMQAFLMSVGRQKFVVPLYTALRANDEDRPGRKRVQGGARALPPETQSSVDKQMGKNKGTEECST
jgi:leukotriene-A4 hydrolase